MILRCSRRPSVFILGVVDLGSMATPSPETKGSQHEWKMNALMAMAFFCELIGYFYGIIHLYILYINGVFLVLITDISGLNCGK